MLAGAYYPAPMARTPLLLVAAVAALVLAGSSAASVRDTFVFVHTPSGNIACVLENTSAPTRLRCDIKTGIKPAPPKPKGCHYDWGSSVGLHPHGRAFGLCVSDTVIGQKGKTLAYGTTWTRAGFRCLSQRTALRCHNLSGHGFSISKQRTYQF
jgi:hypothetical protein